MMYISMLDNGRNAVLELEWHVGESLPAPLNKHNKHLVVAVLADGDELELIQTKVDNLVQMKNAWRQMWRGELAQFIVDNIVDR